MSLGAQCHSCRKRRVRCDSDTPACQKCIKAGIDCPGYGKSLTWVGGPKSRRKQPGTKFESDSNSAKSMPSSSSTRFTNEVTSLDLESGSQSSAAIAPTPKVVQRPMSWLTTEDLLMLESIDYFNNVICPELTTITDFSRNIFAIPPNVWTCHYPNLLRKIIVCISQGNMAFRSRQNHLKDRERAKVALEYKSEVLETLNKRIADKTLRVDNLTLLGVLLILMAEIANSQNTAWAVHLEGARQLIKLKGGFSACLSIFHQNPTVLWSFMMIDVMHSTTCNAALFASSDYLDNQISYLEHFEEFYETYEVNSYCPCPKDVLRIIILTNIQRAEHHLRRSNKFWRGRVLLEDQAEGQFHNVTEEDLMAQLRTFPVEKWAERAERRWQLIDSKANQKQRPKSKEGLEPLREQESWIAIGQSYQAAAMLFLLRTLVLVPDQNRPSTSIFSSMSADPEPQRPPHLNAISLRDLAMHTLMECLPQLMATKFDKVMFWPLFVAGFEGLFQLCDPADRHSANIMFAFSTEHLARLAYECGSTGGTSAVEMLHATKKNWYDCAADVVELEDSSTAASSPNFSNAGNEPLWDSAFPKRYVFIL